MNTSPQLTMFGDVVLPKAVPSTKVSSDTGKRKTEGWFKKAVPKSLQDSLAFESIPLNDEGLEEDYQAIHEKLLFVSLTPCLGDNVSLDHLNEIIEWVLVPIVLIDRQAVTPFSFQACCVAANVDVEKMQDLVFPVLQKAQDSALNIN